MTTPPLTNVDLIDVYAASSQLESERIVAILADEGVEAQQSESSVAGFPTDSGHRFLITVFAPSREKAHAVIEQARTDAVITDDGSFLNRG